MKVSIIVPVYNVEQYVEKCIQSILEQTYDNYEVIIVDDGSTDLSGQICDKFGSDSKVTVYHKENGGLSSARNYGMAKASGELIAFVDSDDYLSNDYLSILVKALVDNDADMSLCRYTRKENDFLTENDNVNVVSAEKILENIIYQKDQSLYSVAAWNKLYRKKIFDVIRYPEGKINEDMYIICEVMKKCKKIAVCDNKLYYYRINSNSITQKKFTCRNMDVIEACNHICDFVGTQYSNDKLISASYNLIFRRSFQMLVKIWSNEQAFPEEESVLIDNIMKYKKSVLFDFDSKFSTKLTALMLYVNLKLTKRLVRLVKK